MAPFLVSAIELITEQTTTRECRLFVNRGRKFLYNRPPNHPATMSSHRPLRYLLLLISLIILMVMSGFGAYRIAQQLGLADLQTTGLHRLDLYSASLEREIGKYAFLPGTLGLERDVLALLEKSNHDKSGKLEPQVNAYLEQLNERAGTLSIYLIDTNGHVVASSNWRRADSFVGEELAFRPYFREAMEGGHGLLGIGTTRGEPGYYLASKLTDDNETLGVAVIKVSLEQLEKSWTTVETPAMVSDENGVVILGSVANWKFTTLRPLEEKTRTAFDQTQQYNRRALKPLGLKELRELDHGARLVSIAKDSPEIASVYPVAGVFWRNHDHCPVHPGR
jgi:two-component system C4-dicarboxylate transport sensor histidine kinase DctB